MEQRPIVTRTRKEVFELWLAALRSGKYKQGFCRLRTLTDYRDNALDQPAFCCLGVLCELARQDGGPEWVGSSLYMDSNTTLSFNMRQFMGLSMNAMNRLIRMNDTALSFEQIADRIEREIMPRALKQSW